MAIELTVPQVGESITEVQIGQWLKKEGDTVRKGDILVEIETDKVTVELPAPADGRLGKLLKQDGQAATVGEVIGYMEEAGAPAGGAGAPPAGQAPAAEQPQEAEPAPERAAPKPVAAAKSGGLAEAAGPPASRPTAPGRLSQEARAEAMERRPPEPAPRTPAAKPAGPARARTEAAPAFAPEGPTPQSQPAVSDAIAGDDGRALAKPRVEPAPVAGREEQVVPMSPLRRRVAARLVQAQHTAALLTTYNEVDMSAVMALRARHQPAFQERYQVKLGLMSFFVKAAIDALKRFPQLNAEIRGTDIVFRNYYDIGVAVSTDKGLVVPVLRNAERMSFADIELAVADFAVRARSNKLKLNELEGGTFTITNGGVFGSLLSTPIINPPQSGILGLHAVQDRPVAREGQVVIRPMMYVALTYDHRIVDGREAVTFLRRIKEVVEEPSRMLVEI